MQSIDSSQLLPHQAVKRVHTSLIGESNIQIPFKIIIIGQSATGKTSILNNFIHGKFNENYDVTVGVDYASKVIKVTDEDQRDFYAQLKIWDTCGQDVFGSLTSLFFKGACGVFLVFSLQKRSTFQKVHQWYNKFIQNGSTQAAIFLIGNKADLQRQVTQQQALEFMKQISGVSYIETSAKTGENIQYIFTKAAEILTMKFLTSKQFRDLIRPKMTSSFYADGSPEYDELVDDNITKKPHYNRKKQRNSQIKGSFLLGDESAKNQQKMQQKNKKCCRN